MSTLLETVEQNAPGRMVSVRFEKVNGAVGIYTLILANYGGVLRRDLVKVMALVEDFNIGDDGEITFTPGPELAAMASEIGQTVADMCKAWKAVYLSITSAIERRATGMVTKGSYTKKPEGYDGEGIREHVSGDGRVYVVGLLVKYHHVKDGKDDGKRPTKRATTIAKDAIRAGLSRTRWKHLPGGQIVKLSADGRTWDADHDGTSYAAL